MEGDAGTQGEAPERRRGNRPGGGKCRFDFLLAVIANQSFIDMVQDRKGVSIAKRIWVQRADLAGRPPLERLRFGTPHSRMSDARRECGCHHHRKQTAHPNPPPMSCGIALSAIIAYDAVRRLYAIRVTLCAAFLIKTACNLVLASVL